MLVYVTVWKVD